MKGTTVAQSTRAQRIAIYGLTFWALTLCADLGLLAFCVLDVFAVFGTLTRGYESALSLMFWARVGMATGQCVAFWALRRATGAVDPFVVTMLGALPVTSLIISPTIIHQAATDLEAQGYPTGIRTAAIWAWVFPVACLGVCWAVSLMCGLFGISGLTGTFGVVGAVGFFVVPIVLRLRIALVLRAALREWHQDQVISLHRASRATPTAA